MKGEFGAAPPSFTEQWPGELASFSWQDFLTAIPAPLFVVTGYKANGLPNASLQSWSAFVGDGGEFICILGSVSRRGHLLEVLRRTGAAVLNFPSADVYERCAQTVRHNKDEDDEIAAAGLTAEPARTVAAPRIAECFLCIEAEFLWEREHYPGSRDVTAALRATHIAMDPARWDEARMGRYGPTGYLYNIHSPRNADTGEVQPDGLGILTRLGD